MLYPFARGAPFLALALVLSPAAGLLPEASPLGPRPMESILQDDALVLHRTPSEIQANLAQMKELGVTRLRVTAVWMEIAPNGHSKVRPTFDASDPAAYAPANWARLDRAIRLANAAGLTTMIDVGFFAPLWATADPETAARGVTRPDAIEFGQFAKAVARRYDGTHRDAGGLPIPAVGLFTLWNEPNIPGFLQPQWDGTSPLSPDLYRPMVIAGYEAIKGARSDARVLIGGTSSTGSSVAGRGSVPPLTFVRALACVDRNLVPLATPGCADYAPLPGDGWAHHPYELKAEPWVPSPEPSDNATMGDLPKLIALLNALAASGRVAPGLANVWLTEFGYETNDPVWNKPWTLAQQPTLLAQAEYLAWQLPEVRSFPQFLLRDIETEAALAFLAANRTGRAPGSWQTGLFFESGTAKPAAASFPLTLLPMANGSGVNLWGRIRPADGPALAAIEATPDGATWSVVTTSDAAAGGAATQAFLTASDGLFLRATAADGATAYRLVWLTAVGGPMRGPVQDVQVERAYAP